MHLTPGFRIAMRRTSPRTLSFISLFVAFLFAVGGFYALVAAEGLARRTQPPATPLPGLAPALIPATVARMDSPPFHYSPGWTVSAAGADPAEPANPALAPSGVITFTYEGNELALLLAQGAFWGYIYVTVDGAPANLLPRSRAHIPAPEPPAGYRPLYAPDLAQEDGAPTPAWVRVDYSNDDGPHTARVEVWRSWGQIPLRAVAVDALPAQPYPFWSGVLMLVVAAWFAVPLWGWLARVACSVARALSLHSLARWLLEPRRRALAAMLAALGLVSVITSAWSNAWSFCVLGVVLLGVAGLIRPALWYAALCFGLPFYYSVPLPLLPTRAVNLVDAGVFLGLGIALVHATLVLWSEARTGGRAMLLRGRGKPVPRTRFAPAAILLLALIASWAFVSVMAAARFDVALREWRTVFLMGLALAAGLLLTLRVSRTLRADVGLVTGGWLAGATFAATLALLLYPDPAVTIDAEGVARLRGFYGSPNNLALYLERALAVTLALALFLRARQLRIVCALAAVVQGAALVLTFSRGGLLVALPLIVLTLWVAGYFALRRERRPARVLWLLAVLVALVTAALLPFVGTERFQQVVTVAQGTGFLRLNLWRSAWQMALDYPLLGVGPDNFLYAYRSGYVLPQAWQELNLNHPHNWPLDWWTRIGLPGLALALLFWGMLLLGIVRGTRVRGWSPLFVGLLAATVAALAHGLLDASYALPDLMAVWALFAVLASIEVLPFE